MVKGGGGGVCSTRFSRLKPLVLSAADTWLLLTLVYLVLLRGTVLPTLAFPVVAATHAIAFITLLAWLAWKTIARSPLPRTALDLPIAVFLALSVLSALLGVNPRLALENVLQYCGYAAAYYMGVDYIRRRRGRTGLMEMIQAVTVLVIEIGLLEWIMWYLDVGQRANGFPGWLAIGWPAEPLPPVAHKLAGTLGNPNVLAGYLVVALPLLLVGLWSVPSRRLALLISIGGGLVVFYLCASEGGVLGMAVAMAILLVAWAWRKGQGPASLQPRWLARIRQGRRAGYGRDDPSQVPVGLAGRTRELSFNWLSKPLHAFVAVAVLALVANGALLLLATRVPSLERIDPGRVAYWQAAAEMVSDRPLLGGGPGTFRYNYGQYDGAELGTLAAPGHNLAHHAHNIFFQTSADMGILGIAAACWLVSSAGLVALSQYRRSRDPRERGIILGGVAGLGGLLAHGMVEYLLGWVSIGVTVALIVALVASGNDDDWGGERPRGSRWGPAGALILVCLAAILVARSDQAFYHGFRASAAAGAGQWADAMAAIEEAINLDKHLDYYRLQLLAARMQVGLEPEEARQVADEYQTHVNRYVDFAFAHANLALLHWQAGNRDAAVAEMRGASAMAPREALYPLNLAKLYEKMGNSEEANDAYALAVARDVTLAPALHQQITQNEGQRWVTVEMKARQYIGAQTYTTPAEKKLSMAKLSRVLGDIPGAWGYLGEARSIDPTLKATYTEAGLLYLRENRMAEALNSFDAALGADGRPLDREAYLHRASAWLSLGQKDDAARDLLIGAFCGVKGAKEQLAAMTMDSTSTEGERRGQEGMPPAKALGRVLSPEPFGFARTPLPVFLHPDFIVAP